MSQRRVSLPVLIGLLALLGGMAFFVLRSYGETESEHIAGANADELADPDARRASEEERRAGEWQHHDWPGVRGREGAGARERESGEGAGAEPSEEQEGVDGRSSASRHVDGWYDESGEGRSEEDVEDPQVVSMRRSFRLARDGDAGMSLPFDPMEQDARIVAHEGSLRASDGDTCQVRVLPVRSSAYNCLLRVMCAGQVLYPNPDQTAGYAPCDVVDGRVVSALDDGHSAADGDPLINFDAAQGIITVEDRGDGVEPFRATLRLSRRL
jgi:hypothetical protein